METVFGRAFIHETEEGYETYNCRNMGDGFQSEDSYLKEWVVYATTPKDIIINGSKITLQKGLQVIRQRGY
jgi:hypothetical protein